MNRNVYLGLGVLLGAVWSGCSAQNGVPDAETGGSVGTGGTQNPSTGGISSGGVSSPTGGTPATGGAQATGGSNNNGGSDSTGGVLGGGGSTATGGQMNTGGGSNTGGNAGSAGKSTGGSGGKAAMGGQGGGKASTGGNGTGGNSTGGVTSTPCTLSGSPNPGSGSFTYYYFGQGTYKDPNSGKYQTACGYLGTGNGMSDSVENIATPNYFVAIPGQNSTTFANNKYCGACVQLTNGGTSLIATVIDECPLDSNPKCVNAHLDVSKAAFDRLGYATGDPSGTTWKFVPCPVMGNVKIRVKNGNPNEIYIENLIVALQSVTLDGAQANRQSYGAWHFGSNIPSGATLTLTDVAGRTITVTVTTTTQGQNQDTGKQFPTCQ